MNTHRKKLLLWILTILFFTAVSLRFNISIIAWVMFVPLLILIRDANGWKSWVGIFILLQMACLFQIGKIITEPLPPAIALMYSVPMASGMWPLLWIYEKVRRRIGALQGVFLFAVLMSASEWLVFSFSEFGSWGAMAYSQLNNLAFLQLTSLFGITFASFFIYLSSAFVTLFISSDKRQQLIRPAMISLAIFTLFYAHGVIRLDTPAAGKQLQAAAIASEMIITPKGIPDADLLQRGTQKLIDKTQQAIDRGVQLVAWNEGATIISKQREAAFIEQITSISRQSGVELVIAYIVPIDGIHRFENKYLFISKGEVLDEYFKLHPVPGEGSIKGEHNAKVADLKYGKVGGAICYDFDFPSLGRSLSQQGIDLAVVPASDWRGIDPYHAQMAIVRGIEGGYAVLRPARASTSIATDAYGRILASMNYFEDNDKIMLATIPLKQVDTLYSKVGDVFVLLCALYMCYAGYLWFRNVKESSINHSSVKKESVKQEQPHMITTHNQ